MSPRVYNNLYFDTPEGTCLEDHTRGKNIRYKVRVRQYANTGVAFLEVKLRDVHSKTFKHRIVRQCQRMGRPSDQRRGIRSSVHLPNAIATTLWKPVLQSSFERFTWPTGPR